jgi:hypothetical protein
MKISNLLLAMLSATALFGGFSVASAETPAAAPPSSVIAAAPSSSHKVTVARAHVRHDRHLAAKHGLKGHKLAAVGHKSGEVRRAG